MRVTVTGSHGALGTSLVAHLRSLGHDVTTMTRSSPDKADYMYDPRQRTVDAAGLEGRDAVVHLNSTALLSRQRWGRERLTDMIRRQVQRSSTIAGSLAGLEQPPKVIICESSVAIYGDRGDKLLDESRVSGNTLASAIVEAWEAAGAAAVAGGVRTVFARLGRAVGRGSGYFEREVARTRRHLGGPIGGGQQWVPWISMTDVTAAIVHMIETATLEGPVNLVGPEPVRQREFASSLAAALHRRAFVPLPKIAARAMFGGTRADETLLASQRAVPAKLLDSGFRFQHSTLAAALAAALGPPPSGTG